MAERRTGTADTNTFHQRALSALAAFYDSLRHDLHDRLNPSLPLDSILTATYRTLLQWIDPLTLILSDSQLAAYLGGAAGVASMLPAEPPPGIGAAEPLPAAPSGLTVFERVLREQTARPEVEWARQRAAITDPVTAGGMGGSGLPPRGGTPTISGDWQWPGMRVWLPVIEEAADDLRSRNLLTRLEFDRASEAIRRDAFTVAYQSSTDALERVRSAVVESVVQGEALPEFTKRVDEALESSSLGPGHLENVFRTNVQASYSRGMDKVLDDSLVRDAFPYEEVLPIRDSRLTSLCYIISKSGIQGTGIFRRDDPVYQRYKSPRHWQDRCGRRPMSVADAAARGIHEAQRWLKTGEPPAAPAWVDEPELDDEARKLFEQWVGVGYRLSSAPWEESEHPRNKQGEFAEKGEDAPAEKGEDAPSKPSKSAQIHYRKAVATVEKQRDREHSHAERKWRRTLRQVEDRQEEERLSLEEEIGKAMDMLAKQHDEEADLYDWPDKDPRWEELGWKQQEHWDEVREEWSKKERELEAGHENELAKLNQARLHEAYLRDVKLNKIKEQLKLT